MDIDITDPYIAAAHVANEISSGDRFTTTIIVRESDFSDAANADDALEHALAADALRWDHAKRCVRVDVVARHDIHGLEIDVDDLELPDDGQFVTVVVSLVSPFYLDGTHQASVYADIRRVIQDREEASDRYVNRVIFKVAQEGR